MATLLQNLESLQEEAARFANTLSAATEHATLITLSGELGAGKTSFVQGVARALGVTEPITSPTFVLEKVYELPGKSGFKELVHIDSYRLEGDTSLVPLGFSERYANPTTLILLEWPELVESQLPLPDIAITLAVDGEGRTISYD